MAQVVGSPRDLCGHFDINLWGSSDPLSLRRDILDTPKFYRCEKCRKLLTDRMIRKGVCSGHKIGYAEEGTIWEWIKIKIGLVR